MLSLRESGSYQPLRLSDDGRYAAFKGSSLWFRRRDLTTGEWMETTRAQGFSANDFALSASGRFLVSRGIATIDIWDGKSRTNGTLLSFSTPVSSATAY